jgi:hypothetical protein
MLVCPHCELVAAGGNQTGEHCILVQQRDGRLVILKEHLDQPSPSALQEATKLLFQVDDDGRMGSTGMIDETDVAGHWGMKLIPTQHQGQSKAHS